jgi:hypothetical protein
MYHLAVHVSNTSKTLQDKPDQEGYLRNKKWYLIRSAHAVYICNEKLSMTRNIKQN